MVKLSPILILLLTVAQTSATYGQFAGGTNTPVIKDSKSLKLSDYDKLISYYRYYKPDSALFYAKKAIEIAKLNKDTNGLATVYNQVGMIEDNGGNFDESRQYYLDALNLYDHTGSLKGIATENIRLGVIENRKGNYDRAMRYFLDALKVSEKSNNLPGKLEAYLTMSEAYSGQRKYDEALKHLNLADQLNKVLPFSSASLNLLNAFGVLYRETGDLVKAKDYFEKGISLSNKPQFQGLNITLTVNLASVYAKQGFKGKSIELLQASLAKARKINNFLRELLALTSLAGTYWKEDPQNALLYFNQALALVRSKPAQKQEIDILDLMAELYHSQGNDTQAFLVKREEHKIADTYYYQRMARQIADMQMKYELDKSNASVRELTLINSRQELERKIILCFTAFTIFILVIVILFYSRTRKLNGLLNKANLELNESNTVKDKLFSVLAHDLRAPFTTIIGMLQVINDDDMTADDRRELVDMVSVSSTASLDILNNLLKWGEMQLKGVRIKPVTLDPHDVINQNIALLSGMAELKAIHIQNNTGQDITIVADRDHFDFVLRNLLSNAIKFTHPEGNVSLTTVVDDDKKEVRFIITDDGIGIAANKIDRIFDISNVSTNGTNDEKGTSLGLVLCREFIEANKGKIWVESKPGHGSSFIFTLKQAMSI